MLEALSMALQAQNVSEDKIQVIVERLSRVNTEDVEDSIWRAFCEGCLEVGVDPQAVFALAISNYEDAMDHMGPEIL